MKLVFKREKKVPVNVKITEVDTSIHVPNMDKPFPLVLTAKHGPVDRIEFYGSSIAKPRWWQFWRWHLIHRYKRETKDAVKRFEKDFGQPIDPGPLQKLYAAHNATFPPSNAWVVRSKKGE